MFQHRLIDSNKPDIISFDRPFSSFDFVDMNFQDDFSIRRLFSLARAQGAKTLMVEPIAAAGIITEENDDIKQLFTDYVMTGLTRISFWSSVFTAKNADSRTEEQCLGYAILKRDRVPSKQKNGWHVFEAVFRKYPDRHNCVPNPMTYTVSLGKKLVKLNGLLYSQQNGLNKVCAQVALRSLLSRTPGGDVSYRQINDIARKSASSPGWLPADGLSTPQIRACLQGFGIKFRDFDYAMHDSTDRKAFPYQKFVYSGIESGAGALLGFRLSGPGVINGQYHIIPFYGHTFNKDTWAPEADKYYFRVGDKLRYIPSENWTSSFLGHDDNFGPNFCVPRLYITPKQVEYVVELLRPGARYGGSQAEAMSLQFLDSVLGEIGTTRNVWLKRLVHYASRDVKHVVLRALATDRDTYLNHLSNIQDWNGNSESRSLINFLRTVTPKNIWVVEASLPELFPANESKLGDIVLNSGGSLKGDRTDRSNFLFVRLPGDYWFDLSSKPSQKQFVRLPSKIKSHVPVLCFS